MKGFYPHVSLSYHLHPLPEHGIVYVKNPKAGCSTILVWLSRLHTGQEDFSPANVHTENPLPKAGEVGWPRVGRMLGGSAYRFSFVRDPLRRLESAYRDKILRATRPVWREQVRTTLGLPADDDTEIDFEQFVTALEQQDPVAEMDPHWRPQHVNLMHPLVQYDKVGRLESFDEDLAVIRQEAGVPDVPVERRNTRSSEEAHSVYDGRSDLVRRVRDLYATDLELYGY
jgi:hypothetical protein